MDARATFYFNLVLQRDRNNAHIIIESLRTPLLWLSLACIISLVTLSPNDAHSLPYPFLIRISIGSLRYVRNAIPYNGRRDTVDEDLIEDLAFVIMLFCSLRKQGNGAVDAGESVKRHRSKKVRRRRHRSDCTCNA